MVKFVNFSPSNIGNVSNISFLNLGGFFPHEKFQEIFSSLTRVPSQGDGRDNRMCVIFYIRRLLIIIIFPYGVKFLIYVVVMEILSYIVHIVHIVVHGLTSVRNVLYIVLLSRIFTYICVHSFNVRQSATIYMAHLRMKK